MSSGLAASELVKGRPRVGCIETGPVAGMADEEDGAAGEVEKGHIGRAGRGRRGARGGGTEERELTKATGRREHEREAIACPLLVQS